jgi:hypothetical protein
LYTKKNYVEVYDKDGNYSYRQTGLIGSGKYFFQNKGMNLKYVDYNTGISSKIAIILKLKLHQYWYYYNTKIKLFYNDDFRRIDTHQTTLLNLKKEEKIHGVGIQCHVSSTEITNDATLNSILLTIENLTKEYRSYGFEVHFTEIDFNTTTLNHTLHN